MLGRGGDITVISLLGLSIMTAPLPARGSPGLGDDCSATNLGSKLHTEGENG